MKMRFATAGLTGLLLSSTALAAPLTIEGDFVRAVVTDLGVLSSLRYDAAGSRNFPAVGDYVSPGIPFEGFGVRVGTGVNLRNANSEGADIPGTLVENPGGLVSGGSVTWTGVSTAGFSISHTFSFSNTDQRVNILTTLTATTDLTNVRVSRAVDPDPDNFPGGSADTNNQRGIPTNLPPIPTSDFVGSLGSISGKPLGLYYSGPITHDTGIVNSCCTVENPDIYLAGGELGDSSSGDNGIGIGFNLGSIAAGASVSWSYAYVMGGSLGTIDIPPPPPPPPTGDVPVPATALLLGAGLAGLAGLRRRRA
ncbi:MAG: VPLPA-CTERM sorting domain-containing protein [Alphaproteobacteria bacterium]|nr:VPLPA-CTERM sorting domain-containing protein [Alphaproteobacteria bacterium]